jgi:hypothetical protein
VQNLERCFGIISLVCQRQPRYEAMANWGVTVDASEVARAKSEEDFSALIGQALAAKAAP